MKNINEALKERLATREAEFSLSPLERIKRSGGVAHPVRTPSGKAVDSMLAVYRRRCTYTFIMDKEVASIHFDCDRHEIFFRGHNIRGMELTPAHIKTLKSLQEILKTDEEGKLLFNDYVATLTHFLADKNK